MIQPTVGRVVWYYRYPGAEAQAALVSYVHDDRCVNLAVFDHNGNPEPTAPYVPLLQGDEAGQLAGRQCSWMPFQIGQAAKTEAVQAAASKLPDATVTFASESQMSFGGVFARSNGIVTPAPTEVTDTPVSAAAADGQGAAAVAGRQPDWIASSIPPDAAPSVE